MYFHVKFRDGNAVNVPSNFIKNYERNTCVDTCSESEHLVFWSPNESDTPESILKKQKKVIIFNEEKAKGPPIPAYYYAKILMSAETEEELIKVLDSKDGRKIKNGNFKRAKVSEDKSARPPNKKAKLNKDVKQGKRNSLRQVLKDTDVKSLFDNSDSEDDEIIPLSIHKEELTQIKKELNLLKNQNKQLQTEKEELQDRLVKITNLNLEWQDKFFDSSIMTASAPQSQFPTPVAASQFTLSTDTSSMSFSPSPLAVTSPNPSQSSPLINPPDSIHQIQSTQSITIDSNKENCPPTRESNLQKSPPTEEVFELAEAHLRTVLARTKPGPHGDSLFVKNLASAVFTDEVLMVSSVTGVKCNSKKGSKAKPQLKANKLEYIKGLFRDRLEKEAQSTEEREKRFLKLRQYISEKINTLCQAANKKYSVSSCQPANSTDTIIPKDSTNNSPKNTKDM